MHSKIHSFFCAPVSYLCFKSCPLRPRDNKCPVSGPSINYGPIVYEWYPLCCWQLETETKSALAKKSVSKWASKMGEPHFLVYFITKSFISDLVLLSFLCETLKIQLYFVLYTKQLSLTNF